MNLISTFFMSGPDMCKVEIIGFKAHEPEGHLDSIISLSQVQQALWFDYLRRPSGTHYNLILKVDFKDYPPETELLLQSTS